MLSDLILVLKFIKEVLEKYDLAVLYSSYTETLQQISQSSTEELQVELRELKAQIQEAHQALIPVGWSFTQLQLFDQFGAKRLLGEFGYSNFLKALTNNAANTPGAIDEISTQKDKISQLLTNANSILASLGPLAKGVIGEEGKVVLQVVFDENVTIENMPDLFKQSKIWNSIIRAYSMLAKEGPEKTTIISVNKSNPFSIWMSTAPLISRAFYHTIKPLIDLWHEILELKGHAIALDEKRLIFAEKKFDFFKKIEDYESNKVVEIAENVADTYHKKGMTMEEIIEAKGLLRTATKELYEFINKGGKVDAAKESRGDGSLGGFQLDEDYHKVYKLKDQVGKLLEARNSENAQVFKNTKTTMKRRKKVKKTGKAIKQPKKI